MQFSFFYFILIWMNFYKYLVDIVVYEEKGILCQIVIYCYFYLNLGSFVLFLYLIIYEL